MQLQQNKPRIVTIGGLMIVWSLSALTEKRLGWDSVEFSYEVKVMTSQMLSMRRSIFKSLKVFAILLWIVNLFWFWPQKKSVAISNVWWEKKSNLCIFVDLYAKAKAFEYSQIKCVFANILFEWTIWQCCLIGWVSE